MGAGLEAWIHRTNRGARGVLDQAGVEHVGEHQIDLQVHRRLEEASRQQRELKVLGAKDDPGRETRVYSSTQPVKGQESLRYRLR